MNPPYGQRLQAGEDTALRQLYQDIGSWIERFPPGSRAVMITDQPEWMEAVGRPPKRQYPVFNGPIRCRIAVWDL